MAEEVYSSSKRKYEDQTPPSGGGGHRRPTGFSAPISSISPDTSSAPLTSYNNVPPPPSTPMDEIQLAKQKAQEIAARLFSNAEAKRPRTENGGSNDDSYDSVQKPSGFSSMGGQGGMNQSLPIPYGFQGSTGFQGSGSSKKIDIPNGRVGVIIGKGGETIKYLQSQSGAKIQVTRDMDADPNSPNRAVELTGTSEQISKAEQLIKEVLAEAESGGSGLATKRFTGQAGADQFSMKVPNNKVGLIIGKGGETIKTMQAKSGARIQLIPLHPPPGDTSTERTVYIDGTQQQIEAATQLVNEVISENRVRNPAMGGGYSQQGFRPQPPSWGPPGPSSQQPGYGYMQPGSYPGAPPPYNMSQPPYSGYPTQPTSTGWDQTSVPPSQQTNQGSGYDYYNQQPPQQPSAAGSTTTADNSGYNYNQAPASSYNQPQGSYGGSSYSQPPAAQQQGYTQDGYGYHAPAPQTGYGQPGYDQSQGYNSTPNYGANPAQDGAIPAYGTQGAPTQVPPTVQPSAATQQGYPTQQPNTPPSYPTQGPQSAYPTSSQPGYGTQPTSQTGYGQSAPPTLSGYGPPQGQKPPPSQAIYGQPPISQGGYIQPAPVQPGYAQSQTTPTHSGSAQPDASHHRPPSSGLASAAPQAGYAQPPYSVPSSAQPGYGGQQQQPYGDSYAGGYSQPPVYSADSTVGNNAHGSYDAAPGAQPSQQSGVTKASPKS
ncbi:hypothetical protein AQUCO_00100118v1 [Aquilegia coerulea]|uniref:K Homology domain-containing protein n=2 Tax=Aquilegia coerulea TaxID=218851 RepID=A0A2G5F8Z7_AQUCA|nr:hypothetical protein AQUCO_00100118v1 [Aquilegia coerulea]